MVSSPKKLVKEQQQNNEDEPIPLTPKIMGGLKRMTGSTKLQSSVVKKESPSKSQMNTKEEVVESSTRSSLSWVPSLSLASLFASKPEASTSDEKSDPLPLPPRSHLTRTKTSSFPLKIMPQDVSTPNRNLGSSKSSVNLGKLDFQTPGEKGVKSVAKRKMFDSTPEESSTPTRTIEKHQKNSDEVTPPVVMRRTSSGSMLLRQTPERMRRQEEDATPKSLFRKSSPSRVARCGSTSRLDSAIVSSKDVSRISLVDTISTPNYKRKRTSSASLLPSTPTSKSRLRPRRISGSLADGQSSAAGSAVSPTKKKARNVSGSSLDKMESGNSPTKKRCISSATIRLQDTINLTPSCTITTPSRVPRSLKNVFQNSKSTNDVKESEDETIIIPEEESSDVSCRRIVQPDVKHLSSSGHSYHSVASNDSQLGSCFPSDISSVSSCDGDVFVTARSSLNSNPDRETSETTTSTETMVPLVKKQVSIDETKLIEEDEDEGFGDSTKTIKRGQGNHLARSVSLKLMPKREEVKMTKNDTEKCSSTPSLPTAPLIRQTSMSSLRFKVSPSTFLKPLEPPKPIVVATSEPSTSKPENIENEIKLASGASIKSVLRKNTEGSKEPGETKKLGETKRKRVKFDGIDVFYFDRIQGHSTVPTYGEVALDMQNEHHAKRYFPLTTYRRPILDLSLYEDDYLSDGEVVCPDSEEEEDEDNFQSAKTIPKIEPRIRLEILAKSGIQVKRSTSVSAKVLRKNRTECGCECPNGVCVPETCLCAMNGIQCQIDEDTGFPCKCFQETCTNPNGRIFYDYDAVQEHRKRVIMLYQASKKSGICGSPSVKKFVDSDDDDDDKKRTTKIMKVMKLEESPTRYPVTPIYTRRSRCLSDIRESTSENTTGCSSLSERMKGLERLDNDVCVEEDDELNMSLNDTIVDPDVTVREIDLVVVESDSADTSSSSEPTNKVENDMIGPVNEIATPTTTTLVV